MKAKISLLTTGVLMASLLTSSPAALADRSGMHHGNGDWDKQALCEHYRNGTGPFDHDARRAERAESRDEMAERLQLSERQRKIWHEMHQERQTRHAQRMSQWHKKLEQRCDGAPGNGKR